MAEIVLARVDDRLIHGQIVNEWISAVNPTHIIIVDDDLVNDRFMSDIYRALIPIWLEARILSLEETLGALVAMEEDPARIFSLPERPKCLRSLSSEASR